MSASRRVLNKGDALLRWAASPARPVLSAVGIPTPQQLRRGLADGRPRHSHNGVSLNGRSIAVVSASGDDGSQAVVSAVSSGLSACGASLVEPGSQSVDGLVIDATGLTMAGLDDLWARTQPVIGSVATGGRVTVLGLGDTSVQPWCYGLKGWTKSLAQELGRRSTTANLLSVMPRDITRVGLDVVGPLSFLQSDDSAFVSSQTLSTASDLVSHLVETDDDTATVEGGGREDGDAAGTVLAGKVALVTGAARGIGRAIASRLAQEGAHVLAVDVESASDDLHELASRIRATPFAIDVTSPDAPAAILSELAARFGAGTLHTVVHNAGITRDKGFKRMSPDQVKAVLDVNFRAIVGIDQAVTPVMADGGRVVCMSSINGIAGAVGQTNYSFTKAALIGYAQARAPELGRRGITINCIAPGFIETKMTAAVPAIPREMARRTNAFQQGGLPFDIAAATAFFASPTARGVTGTTLRVCGGHTVGA